MAYKDEYEIARLALDPAFQQQVDATFGPGSKVSYRLHPPLLRAMGLQRKIALGRWFDGAFVGLRAMRRVRGSRADIFGYSRMRRLERELDRRVPGQRRGGAAAAAGRHPAAGGRDRGAAGSDPGVRGRQAGQRGAVPGRARIAAGAVGGGRVVGAGGVALTGLRWARSSGRRLGIDAPCSPSPRATGWTETGRKRRHRGHFGSRGAQICTRCRLRAENGHPFGTRSRRRRLTGSAAGMARGRTGGVRDRSGNLKLILTSGLEADSRPMSISWTSVVPSPISRILESR